MKSSQDRILTTHVGSLPRPDDLIEANRKRETDGIEEQDFQQTLQSAVDGVVRRQVDAGLDVVNDGEFGKSMGQRVDYRAWLSYSFHRLGGLEIPADGNVSLPPRKSHPDELVLTDLMRRRDRAKFADAYAEPGAKMSTGANRPTRPICTGPVEYIGQDAIKADIEHFKIALKRNAIEEGFMTCIGPGSASRLGNAYYKTDEEFLFACADAMREEYKAVLDAGLVLQIDDPAIADNWDAVVPEPTIEQYKKFTMVRVEALNQALRGLPQDRIRFHLCWGSWHGPHMTDIPLRDIVDLLLAIKCQGYSFEAANARHEHEWSVWSDVKLPDDKLVIPGFVSHATNVVEHPELVAQRIVRFAGVVGRERVIASTDCGMGGRIHPDIAWAKLEALSQGAKIASRRLWA
jgi:5-methyltetrahydropteroyltriglutamate--homocysteine methyltransferase